MSDIVIKVEHLSKQYRLGQVGTGTISHDVNRWWHTIRGKEDPYLKIGEENDRTKKGNSDYVWALRDVNFEVKQGEVLGIIGRNGAGKSTLLKILSRTTTPTKGNIKIKGRVASLLEVGTGFHPELSGKDNIFLNGAILGMTKAEIKRKFDEIVDFAGVEKYIDTPVKRYSSGMYIRLAFAVAAHLEPEILIVDEVLAVGDADFQKKAIGKMKDVSNKDGRTVLFVSHNMGSISTLCTKCVLLGNGTIESIGIPSTIIEQYYYENNNNNGIIQKNNSNADVYFKEVYTCDSNGVKDSNFAHSADMHLRIKIGINRYNPNQNIGIAMLTRENKRVFTVNKSINEFYQSGSNEMEVEFILSGGLIAANNYSFIVALNTRTGHITYDMLEEVCPIKIYDDGTPLDFAEGFDYGVIILQDKWRLIN